jgi:hypothetical protein
MLGRLVVVGIIAVVAACGAAVPQVPGKGGPPWIELTSEHFLVWTDGSPERARELIREMERFRQIVLGGAFPGASSVDRSLVIMLRDNAELTAFSQTDQARPFAMPTRNPLWPPTIVLSAFSYHDPENTAVAHELTHLISWGAVRNQPRWLAEGMAMYFETVNLDPDSTKADIGIEPRYQGRRIRLPHLMPIAKLFEWKRIGPNESHEYTTAWALFTFLINEHRAELVRYLQLLDNRDDKQAQAASTWSEAFPSLPLSTIDGVLQQWLTTGSHLVTHINIRLRTWPASERRLADPDVYAIRALLHGTKASDAARVQAHDAVAAALSNDPDNVLAWLVRLRLDDKAPTVEQGRALAAAHRDDWRAWVLAALSVQMANGDAQEVQAARNAACQLRLKSSPGEAPWPCERSSSTSQR